MFMLDLGPYLLNLISSKQMTFVMSNAFHKAVKFILLSKSLRLPLSVYFVTGKQQKNIKYYCNASRIRRKIRNQVS